MNKDNYIESQIQSAFITKTLLENDKSKAIKIFNSNFDSFTLVDAIDSYLSFPNNYLFILYFDDIREKLKEILEVHAFKLNNIDDEYLVEEAYATQGNIIEIINSLDEKSEDIEEIENALLLSRGIDSENGLNNKDLLKACYMNDYTVSLYLNDCADKLEFKKELYPIILMSLYYYFNQIVFTNDNAKEKLEILLSCECDEEGKEFIDLYKKGVLATYNESLTKNFDEFIDDNLIEDEDVKKERIRNMKNCQIYDFETAKKRIFKNKQKGE